MKMHEVTISFPGLGIGEFTVNKVAFSIGDISVRWYGIILTLGIVAGFLYACYRSKFEGVIVDDVMDFAIFTVLLAIIGARTYYVLTTLEEYDSFMEAIAIWNGGIAMYGSVIGGALGLFLVSTYKKYSRQKMIKVFDMTAPGVMLGQIIGRWGNFVNGEAHGVRIHTDFFLRMGLCPNEDSYTRLYYYHPTFLYESLWNLVGFVLINIFYKKKKFDGQIVLMYLAWYGFGRMFIEGLRTDSLYVGAFRISQVVGFLCFVICTTLLVYFLVKEKRKMLDGEAYAPVYESVYGNKLTFAKKDISDEDAAKAAAGIDEIIARTAKEQDEARITEEEDQTENNTEKEGTEDGKID